MSSPQEPQPADPQQDPRPDPQADRLRRLAWVAVTAVGLWFVADGLQGMWSGAGVLARVLIGVAGLAVLLAVVLGIVSVVRRSRRG